MNLILSFLLFFNMSNDIETELLNAINEGNYNKVNSMLIVNQIHATEMIDGKPLLNIGSNDLAQFITNNFIDNSGFLAG